MAHINPLALGATNWIGRRVGVCGAALVVFISMSMHMALRCFWSLSSFVARPAEAELARLIAWQCPESREMDHGLPRL